MNWRNMNLAQRESYNEWRRQRRSQAPGYAERKAQREVRAQMTKNQKRKEINTAAAARNKLKPKRVRTPEQRARLRETLRRMRSRWTPEQRQSAVRSVSSWVSRNKEKRLTVEHRRRCRILGCEGTHTTAEWSSLLEMKEHRCVHCGRQEPEIKLTRDHIVPISKGGSNWISNIQPLCRSCNSRKGASLGQ